MQRLPAGGRAMADSQRSFLTRPETAGSIQAWQGCFPTHWQGSCAKLDQARPPLSASCPCCFLSPGLQLLLPSHRRLLCGRDNIHSRPTDSQQPAASSHAPACSCPPRLTLSPSFTRLFRLDQLCSSTCLSPFSKKQQRHVNGLNPLPLSVPAAGVPRPVAPPHDCVHPSANFHSQCRRPGSPSCCCLRLRRIVTSGS